MATFDAAQVILFNFEELNLNLRTSFDGKVWQTLYNTASNGTVWPDLVKRDLVWSIMCGINDLIHIEAELRNLVLRQDVTNFA